MKMFFDTQIKPYNDELKKHLENEDKIFVTQVSIGYIIPVKIWTKTGEASFEFIESSRLRFLRNCLGLKI